MNELIDSNSICETRRESDSIARDAFLEYINGGGDTLNIAKINAVNDGGFLVPQFITVKRPGLIAFLQRIFKDKRGWQEVNLYEQILERRLILGEKAKVKTNATR